MYFRKSKLGDTFYGQPTGSTSASPVSEFEIMGVSDDYVTAARLAQSRAAQRFPASLHVFSRHTGESLDGWAHVSTFARRVNLWSRSTVAWIILVLTIAAICVFIPRIKSELFCDRTLNPHCDEQLTIFDNGN